MKGYSKGNCPVCFNGKCQYLDYPCKYLAAFNSDHILTEDGKNVLAVIAILLLIMLLFILA